MKAYVVVAVFGRERAGGLGLLCLTAPDDRTAIAVTPLVKGARA